jgi:hypothetical protein
MFKIKMLKGRYQVGDIITLDKEWAHSVMNAIRENFGHPGASVLFLDENDEQQQFVIYKVTHDVARDGTINPLPDYQLVLYPDPEEIYQHITGDYEISLSASLSHEGKDHSHPIITRRGHVDVEKWIEECVRDELGFIYRQPPKATLKL